MCLLATYPLGYASVAPLFAALLDGLFEQPDIRALYLLETGSIARLKTKRNRARDLFAYTDESGNTGQNLFDETQPHFWTGTLLTNADVDLTGQTVHQTWLSRLQVSELHGSALGIGKINKISAELRVFLQAHSSRFVFTQIEKGSMPQRGFHLRSLTRISTKQYRPCMISLRSFTGKWP